MNAAALEIFSLMEIKIAHLSVLNQLSRVSLSGFILEEKVFSRE
jgi:hypothetical protein